MTHTKAHIKSLRRYSIFHSALVGVLEVLKGMQELGVAADVDTFHSYILPVFSSTDAARQALKVCVGVCECVLWLKV